MNYLQQEFEFFLANHEDFVAKYNGKVIAIKNCEVLGDYDSELEAFTAMAADHEVGTFIIQRVTEGDEAYTATFQSRVASP